MSARHPTTSPLHLLVLGSWLYAAGSQCQTTVPVFLPSYEPNDWEILRGSVVSSDKTATTYTIFCAQQTPLLCELAGELPFQFAEGPSTLDFSGSVAGKITADFNCKLAGTTAATCSGSTSYGSDFTEGSVSGPTQTSWTSTLTGSQVAWAVLTLTTPGTSPATTNIEGTAMETPTATTAGPATARPNGVGRLAAHCMPASLVGVVMAGLWLL